MNAKEFEKAEKAMKRIKELDKEILKIQKFAENISSGEGRAQFDLSMILPEKKEEVKVECDVDPFDFSARIHKAMYGFQIGGYTSTKPNSKANKDTIAGTELSDIATLQILSIILSERIRIRKSHISSLEKLGVKLS